MAFASKCACGNTTESLGGVCDRCVALQALELGINASDEQIENAYRTLVRVWHPDRFQHDPMLRLAAEEKLKEINSAHEYLVSPEAFRPQAQATRRRPEQVEEHVFEAASFQSSSAEDDNWPEAEPGLKTPEIRRALRRQRQGKSSLSKHLMQTAFTFGSIAMLAILWLAVDALMMSNPKTAGRWEQQKAEVVRDLQASGLKLWGNAKANTQPQKDEATPSTATEVSSPSIPQQTTATNAASAPNTTVTQTSVSGPPHIKVGDSTRSAKPYVTSGLTTLEVLSILGSPTSSSGEKMFYKDSEIDFRGGHVVGWVIDPKTPIRVKLWPDGAPLPGLTHFAVGSSKSDVIALQGTPTLFSDNRFGYGSSVVFFQNNRVVGWKDDPNSVRLRVAP